MFNFLLRFSLGVPRITNKTKYKKLIIIQNIKKMYNWEFKFSASIFVYIS